MKKYVIFGAGKIGRLVLQKYSGQVAYFIDNNADLWNKDVDGIPIKSLDYYIEKGIPYTILIATVSQDSIIEQLQETL